MTWYLQALRSYADFAGRARRAEFWYFTLFDTLILWAVLAVDLALDAAVGWWGAYLTVVYFLATLVPSVAVRVRRLHDIGRSGWWWLIGLVPLGPVVLLVFNVQDGTCGPNRHGPDPKRRPWVAPPAATYAGRSHGDKTTAGTDRS